tara:strand:+ start:20 stop:454 length:435 start_codon:yes stop_codon:yes gene_type:complete
MNFICPKINHYLSLVVCLLFIIFNINPEKLNALDMNTLQNELVTEELRLKVPADMRDVWLNAEKNIWEPWLSSQDGFMGRQIFWDKEKEEALILVNWKNKKLWKNIPMSEVNKVQEKFENNVKTSLNVIENPFELIYEGELDKQ